MQTNGEIIFGTNVSANYQLEVNAEQIDQRCTKKLWMDFERGLTLLGLLSHYHKAY